MGITKSKGRKEVNDKFYTNSYVAKSCIELVDLSEYDVIIEPSAGNGSFSSQIDNCIAYDIKPEHTDIVKQDYLKLDITEFKDKKVLTIGNPPFGVQSNLAIKFFNKAAEYSDTIAFILPMTFMKESIQNKLDRHFILEKYIELPKNSFLLNDEPYDVHCIFQVWRRTEYDRILNTSIEDNHLIEFVTGDDYDFVIHRIGTSAGKAFIPESGKVISRQSNYFVKNISNYNTDTLIDMINDIDMVCAKYVVGPPSVSKKELVKFINKVYEKETRRKADDLK